MSDAIESANKIALDLTSKYQRISYDHIAVPVPYFINTAEQEYKKAMRSAGIQDELVNKVIQSIKEGQTALGSTGGKGSPEEIEGDLKRLMLRLSELGYNPRSQRHIRAWMKEMHVGLDCSGYVYNVLKAVGTSLEVDLLEYLAWVDPKTKKPSHAGAFIFDSDNLETINDHSELRPLDILVFKDHVHVGLILKVDDKLSLVDCSMGNDGITFYDTQIDNNQLSVASESSWNRHLGKGNIKIKRLKL